ncbi:MAG TPA: DRTGG domain-containing protein [bacterium]|jgi:BioD-like phosphotransacetylase family protein|nr:DRTGG domain-containing protein [bacterium]
MKLAKLVQLLNAEVLVAPVDEGARIAAGGAADLISDVLAFVAKRDTVLLTGLTNVQVVTTADLMDLAGIVFVRGKKPGQDVLRMAEQRSLPLFRTHLHMYEACGILYQAGLGSSRASQGDNNAIG